MSKDVLKWLEDWYRSQCDGDWEHEYGIKIDTLDNPGWSVEISLTGTAFAEQLRVAGERFTTEHDWVFYKSDGITFKGSCGPQNLSDLLEVFRTAVSNEPKRVGQTDEDS